MSSRISLNYIERFKIKLCYFSLLNLEFGFLAYDSAKGTTLTRADFKVEWKKCQYLRIFLNYIFLTLSTGNSKFCIN